MKSLMIATRNEGKKKEFIRMLQTDKLSVFTLNDYPDLPEIEETGSSFQENAALKAEAISNLLDKPVLADDSGLEIDYLNGKPGVFSARYAGEHATDEENIKKVLKDLQGVPFHKRTARFKTIIALAKPKQKTIFTSGICEGKIGFVQSGTNGFGYDPIFIPKGYLVSMASLSLIEKNRISHRTRALIALQQKFSL